MNKHAFADFAVAETISSQSTFAGFPVGTRVRTEHGERSVETLQPGDRVVTRYGKLVEVQAVDRGKLASKKRPIVISKDALGGGLPRRDVMVAPDQQILLADPLLEQLFDCTTAVVTAKHLLDLDGVEEAFDITPLSFVQVKCDAPEVLFCSGLSCISHASGMSYDRAPVLRSDMAKFYFDQL